MKTNNHDFLEKLAKKALEKANELDTDEPKLVWPKPEEVRGQKPPCSKNSKKCDVMGGYSE